MTIQINITLKCDEYGPPCEATVIVPVYSLMVAKVPGEAVPKFGYDQISNLGWTQKQTPSYGEEVIAPRHYCPEHSGEDG